MKAKFVLMEAGKKTVNGHVYSEKALRCAVKECQKRIKTGALLGWVDTNNARELPLGRVSHKITKLRFDGRKKQLVGELEMLDTPLGKKAWKMIKDGAVGPNPLGMGRPTKTGRVTDYKFTTVGMSPIDQCDPGMSFTVVKGDNKA